MSLKLQRGHDDQEKKVLSVKKHLERASEGGQGRSRKKQKTKVNNEIRF